MDTLELTDQDPLDYSMKVFVLKEDYYLDLEEMTK